MVYKPCYFQTFMFKEKNPFIIIRSMKKLVTIRIIKVLCILFCICNSYSVASQKKDKNIVLSIVKSSELFLDKEINCTYVDSYDFLWIGTSQGLYLFDGYKFINYGTKINNSTLIDNFIHSIMEDTKGSLWVGTSYGLFCLNTQSNVYKEYYHNKKDAGSISSNKILKIFIAKNNTLWIATNNGLCVYKEETDNFKQYPNHVPNNVLANKEIYTISESPSGEFWIGTWSGNLSKFNPKTEKYSFYFPNLPAFKNRLNKHILSIECINDSTLIINDAKSGIVYYNPIKNIVDNSFYIKNKSFITQPTFRFLIDSHKRLWLAQSDSIKNFNYHQGKFIHQAINTTAKNRTLQYQPSSFYEDRNGIIWITTWYEKLILSHPYANDLSNYLKSIPKDNTNDKSYITSFVKDKNENIWMGTFDKGLFKYNPISGKFNSTKFNEKQVIINHVSIDAKGYLWISTKNLLYILNPTTNSTQIFKNPKDKKEYIHNVSFTYHDSNNNVWIKFEDGLDCFNLKTGYIKSYTSEQLNGLNSFKITSIIEDKNKNIWIGTIEGLNKIEPNSNKTKQYFNEETNPTSLASSYINYNGFYLDSDKNMWVSTKKGVCKYNSKTDTFERLEIIGNTTVIDKRNGFLWLANNSNLIKYNIVTGKMISYSKLDGIQLNNTQVLKLNNGFLYLADRFSDFYFFNPENIKENPIVPKIYITQLLLFNKPIEVNSNSVKSPLKESIFTAKELHLAFNQNSIGFEFSSLNYLLPEKNQYAYMLEGVDKEWVYTDYKKRFASYSNLAPGTYVFRVKGSNNDGVWNEEGTHLKVVIMPPWWKTWFAYGVYLIFFFFLIYIARKITLHQAHLKNSLRMEHYMREKDAEMIELRTRFFTNISHEFRTPLTLLMGPFNKLMEMTKENSWNEEVLNYFQLMRRSIHRIDELTHQLLDMRKLESNNMKLEIYKGDIISLLKNITNQFNELSVKKNIDYSFTSNLAVYQMWIDDDKIKKIISNLLSNAFKFTPPNGKISVVVNTYTTSESTKNNFISITVTDSGIGIPSDKVDKIFEQFFQLNNSYTRKADGTGIGLALVKELVQLYKGSVSVESTLEVGSKFCVTLPTSIEQLDNYILITAVNSEIEDHFVEVDELHSKEETNSTDADNTNDNQKMIVLLVEDNTDMRNYIKTILHPHYTIIEAVNGKEGELKAIEYIPDVIISDIMMPEMDGKVLTNRIKSDERTSHIPIILLTSLASFNHKLEGLKTGADDYLTKPFNEEILKVKVRNLIDNKLKYKEYLAKQWKQDTLHSIELFPTKIELPDYDEKFIHKAMEIVEKNIDNTEFDIEVLASDLCMHRYSLYRKFNAVLNMNPGDFIRDIRMKRAAQLLLNKHLNIMDISFMVGFNDPKYFSKVFKKQFGKTPTQYANDNTE